MRVFVTGGTGTIGSAVVAELLAHGHTVLGLARSDRSAAALAAAGADVLPGDIGDLDVLRAGVDQSEGVISLAFTPDYSSADGLARATDEEQAALDALGEQLSGSGRPIVTVSGTPWITGRTATEADPLPTEGVVARRGRTVTALLDRAAQGVRATSVRMPRTVHDHGEGGFAGLLTAQAAAPACPDIPVTALNAGPPCTPGTRPRCSGWPWNRRPAARPGTRSPTRATRSTTSPPSSAAASVCPSARYPSRTSARSARSSQWTSRPPAPTPGKRWPGSPPTRACWQT